MTVYKIVEMNKLVDESPNPHNSREHVWIDKIRVKINDKLITGLSIV